MQRYLAMEGISQPAQEEEELELSGAQGVAPENRNG
jgi:hypothetical protein